MRLRTCVIQYCLKQFVDCVLISRFEVLSILNIARKRETNEEESKLFEKLREQFSRWKLIFHFSFLIIFLFIIAWRPFNSKYLQCQFYRPFSKTDSTKSLFNSTTKQKFRTELNEMKKINTIPSIKIKDHLFHGGAKKKKKRKIINHANDYIFETNCFRLETREIKKSWKEVEQFFRALFVRLFSSFRVLS